MLISEAIKEAMISNGKITREKYKGFGIKPTSLYKTLMIFSETKEIYCNCLRFQRLYLRLANKAVLYIMHKNLTVLGRVGEAEKRRV